MRKNARQLGVGLAILGALVMLNGTTIETASATSAAWSELSIMGAIEFEEGSSDSSCEVNLFGLKPWYSGLAVKDSGGKCVVGTPKTAPDDDSNLTLFIWTIILNVMTDLLVAAGYVATGFLVYGGYNYLLSAGDSGKAAKGKKIITGAVIGLIVVLLARGIVNLVLGVVGG